MKNFLRWLRAIPRWVWMGRTKQRYWTAFAFLMFPLAGVGVFGSYDTDLAIVSKFWQLASVPPVVFAIWQTWKESVAAGWKLRPRLVPSIDKTEGNITLPKITTQAICDDPNDHTFEARLWRLERVAQVQSEVLTTTRRELDKANEKLLGIDLLKNELEVTGTRGAHLAAIGAILIFCGTFLDLLLEICKRS